MTVYFLIDNDGNVVDYEYMDARLAKKENEKRNEGKWKTSREMEQEQLAKENESC